MDRAAYWFYAHRYTALALQVCLGVLLKCCPTSDVGNFNVFCQEKFLGLMKRALSGLEMHKLAVALHFGVYNFVRQHHTLGTTPAVAAGLEEKPWSLEKVVEMTETYWLGKRKTWLA
jgi:hypothetical protein